MTPLWTGDTGLAWPKTEVFDGARAGVNRQVIHYTRPISPQAVRMVSAGVLDRVPVGGAEEPKFGVRSFTFPLAA